MRKWNKRLRDLEEIGMWMWKYKVVGLKVESFMSVWGNCLKNGTCSGSIIDYFLDQKYIVEKKVLKLNVKGKWFGMIAQDVKKEEYREVKDYWRKRLRCTVNLVDNFREFDEVWFSNGCKGIRDGRMRPAPFMRVECKGMKMGIPKKRNWVELSDWATMFYCIELGKVLSVYYYD